MHAYPILSIAIWLPILVGLLVLATGSDRNPAPARWIALIGSVVSFLVTIPLITGFDSSTADLQFVEKANWIERFNITYHLGVDGISMWFVVLTALITVIVVIAAAVRSASAFSLKRVLTARLKFKKRRIGSAEATSCLLPSSMAESASAMGTELS